MRKRSRLDAPAGANGPTDANRRGERRSWGKLRGLKAPTPNHDAAGAQDGVQTDAAHSLRVVRLVAQHVAQRDLAPGGVVAAVEQAFRIRVLPAGDS